MGAITLDRNAIELLVGSAEPTTGRADRWIAGTRVRIPSGPSFAEPVVHEAPVTMLAVAAAGGPQVRGWLDAFLRERVPSDRWGPADAGVDPTTSHRRRTLHEMAQPAIASLALTSAPLARSERHPGRDPVTIRKAITIRAQSDLGSIHVTVAPLSTPRPKRFVARAMLRSADDSATGAVVAAAAETDPSECAWCAFVALGRAVLETALPSPRFALRSVGRQTSRALRVDRTRDDGLVMVAFLGKPVNRDDVKAVLEALSLPQRRPTPVRRSVGAGSRGSRHGART